MKKYEGEILRGNETKRLNFPLSLLLIGVPEYFLQSAETVQLLLEDFCPHRT